MGSATFIFFFALLALPLATLELLSSLDKDLQRAELNPMTITVGHDGSTDFNNITDAIASIPPNNTSRVVVEIRPGFYREKVVIPMDRQFVTLSGDAANPPTISWNDTASTTGTTSKSAAVTVIGNYFIATYIQFENSAPTPKSGAEKGQAVAARVKGDKAAFYHCAFVGYQDTLYDQQGLHYFSKCFIQGTLDFICGNGRSLYEDCHLNFIGESKSWITAQKRDKESNKTGFSFVGGHITGLGHGMVYLGRPWGRFSTVVFSSTQMDQLVEPQGWDNFWSNEDRSKTIYYAEYASWGLGANDTGRVPWYHKLTEAEASTFRGKDYINGSTWIL
ncbi:hypothetical protein AMTRI_Chr04g180520 [Amborella trichopoda]